MRTRNCETAYSQPRTKATPVRIFVTYHSRLLHSKQVSVKHQTLIKKSIAIVCKRKTKRDKGPADRCEQDHLYNHFTRVIDKQKFIVSSSNNIFYIQIHHFTQKTMLNQSLYYTIRYFQPNTKSKRGGTNPSLVADVTKKVGSLKVNANKINSAYTLHVPLQSNSSQISFI